MLRSSAEFNYGTLFENYINNRGGPGSLHDFRGGCGKFLLGAKSTTSSQEQNKSNPEPPRISTTCPVDEQKYKKRARPALEDELLDLNSSTSIIPAGDNCISKKNTCFADGSFDFRYYHGAAALHDDAKVDHEKSVQEITGFYGFRRDERSESKVVNHHAPSSADNIMDAEGTVHKNDTITSTTSTESGQTIRRNTSLITYDAASKAYSPVLRWYDYVMNNVRLRAADDLRLKLFQVTAASTPGRREDDEHQDEQDEHNIDPTTSFELFNFYEFARYVSLVLPDSEQEFHDSWMRLLKERTSKTSSTSTALVQHKYQTLLCKLFSMLKTQLRKRGLQIDSYLQHLREEELVAQIREAYGAKFELMSRFILELEIFGTDGASEPKTKKSFRRSSNYIAEQGDEVVAPPVMVRSSMDVNVDLGNSRLDYMLTYLMSRFDKGYSFEGARPDSLIKSADTNIKNMSSSSEDIKRPQLFSHVTSSNSAAEVAGTQHGTTSSSTTDPTSSTLDSEASISWDVYVDLSNDGFQQVRRVEIKNPESTTLWELKQEIFAKFFKKRNEEEKNYSSSCAERRKSSASNINIYINNSDALQFWRGAWLDAFGDGRSPSIIPEDKVTSVQAWLSFDHQLKQHRTSLSSTSLFRVDQHQLKQRPKLFTVKEALGASGRFVKLKFRMQGGGTWHDIRYNWWWWKSSDPVHKPGSNSNEAISLRSAQMMPYDEYSRMLKQEDFDKLPRGSRKQALPGGENLYNQYRVRGIYELAFASLLYSSKGEIDSDIRDLFNPLRWEEEILKLPIFVNVVTKFMLNHIKSQDPKVQTKPQWVKDKLLPLLRAQYGSDHWIAYGGQKALNDIIGDMAGQSRFNWLSLRPSEIHHRPQMQRAVLSGALDILQLIGVNQWIRTKKTKHAGEIGTDYNRVLAFNDVNAAEGVTVCSQVPKINAYRRFLTPDGRRRVTSEELEYFQAEDGVGRPLLVSNYQKANFDHLNIKGCLNYLDKLGTHVFKKLRELFRSLTSPRVEERGVVQAMYPQTRDKGSALNQIVRIIIVQLFGTKLANAWLLSYNDQDGYSFQQWLGGIRADGNVKNHSDYPHALFDLLPEARMYEVAY